MTGGPGRVEIREALKAERDQLRELTLAVYQQYERDLGPRYWESYRQHIDAALTDLGAAVQLIALTSGEIAGTALYFPPGTSFGADTEAATMSPDCPEVRLLAVATGRRGSGVGRALMETCVERARNDGAPGLVLHTMAMMRAARSLYDRMGFVRAPELDFQPARDWYVEGFRLDF